MDPEALFYEFSLERHVPTDHLLHAIDRVVDLSGLAPLLLWRSAGSEFYFSDVNWPAFRQIDFLRAIRAFQERKRRLASERWPGGSLSPDSGDRGRGRIISPERAQP